MASEPAATGREACLQLTDISPQDNAWDVHKAQADEVADLLAGWDPQLYWRDQPVRPPGPKLASCAQVLGFGWGDPDPASGQTRLKLTETWFCRLRFCPVCQWRKSRRWVGRILEILPDFLQQYPKTRFLFLTLTIRNCHVTDLRQTVGQMTDAWKKLSQRKDFPAFAFIRSLEVTRNRVECTVHPHFHVLLAVSNNYFSGPRYINHTRWVSLWRDCLGVDYQPVVNVKAIRVKTLSEADSAAFQIEAGVENANYEALNDFEQYQYYQQLSHAIVETVKYTTKPDDLIAKPKSSEVERELDRDWLREYILQMRGLRGVTVGGAFRQFLREKEVESDLIHTTESEAETAPETSLYFAWKRLIKRYLLSQQFKP